MSLQSEILTYINNLQKGDIKSMSSLHKLITSITTHTSSNTEIFKLLNLTLLSIDRHNNHHIEQLLNVISTLIPFPSNQKNVIFLFHMVQYGIICNDNSLQSKAISIYKRIVKETSHYMKDFSLYNELMKYILTNESHQPYKKEFLLLVPIVYKYLRKEKREELNKTLLTLSEKENEYIKSKLSEAINSKGYIKYVNENDYVEIFTSLLKSNSEYVKIGLFKGVGNIKYNINTSESQVIVNFLLSLLDYIRNEKSWRVRYAFISVINDLFLLNPNKNKENKENKEKEPLSISNSILFKSYKPELYKFYISFITDEDEEVRKVTILKIDSLFEIGWGGLKKEQFSNQFFSSFQEGYVKEKSIKVKEAYAERVFLLFKYMNTANNDTLNILSSIIYDILDDSDLEIEVEKTREKEKSPIRKKENSASLLKIVKSPIFNKEREGSVSSVSPLKERKSYKNNQSCYMNSIIGSSNISKYRTIYNSNIYNNQSTIRIKLILLNSISYNIKDIKPSNEYESIILKSIKFLFQSTNWKTKTEILDIINRLIPYFSKDSIIVYYNLLIETGFFSNCFIVSEKTCFVMMKIIELYKKEVENKTISLIKQSISTKVYRVKLILLVFIEKYIEYTNENELTQNNNTQFNMDSLSNEDLLLRNMIFLVVFELVNDKSSNIRYLCLKILMILYKKQIFLNEIRSLLIKLQKENKEDDIEIKEMISLNSII